MREEARSFPVRVRVSILRDPEKPPEGVRLMCDPSGSSIGGISVSKGRAVAVMPYVSVPRKCKSYILYVIEASWAQGTFYRPLAVGLVGVRANEATEESGGDGLKDDDLVIIV